jgi:hypothetical protein
MIPPPKKRQCLQNVCILCALEMGGEDGLIVFLSTINFAHEKPTSLACSQFFLLLMLTEMAMSRIRFAIILSFISSPDQTPCWISIPLSFLFFSAVILSFMNLLHNFPTLSTQDVLHGAKLVRSNEKYGDFREGAM